MFTKTDITEIGEVIMEEIHAKKLEATMQEIDAILQKATGDECGGLEEVLDIYLRYITSKNMYLQPVSHKNSIGVQLVTEQDDATLDVNATYLIDEHGKIDADIVDKLMLLAYMG